MSHTQFKDLLGMIKYTIDADTHQITVDYDSALAMFDELENRAANDPVHGQELLSEFYRTITGTGGLLLGDGAPGAAFAGKLRHCWRVR